MNNWEKYDTYTLLFYGEVYRPVSFHVSEQSHPTDPIFEESGIAKQAKTLRLSSGQILFQHVQTKICIFGGDDIQLHCQFLLALTSNFYIVYGWNICFDDDWLNLAYETGLHWFTFRETINSKQGRREKLHPESNQIGMNRARRMLELSMLNKKLSCFLHSITMKVDVLN